MWSLRIKIQLWRMGRWERKGCVAKILPLLSSRVFTIQTEAVKSLGRMKDKKAVPALLSLLKNTNSYTRAEVERSLLHINPSDEMYNALNESKMYWKNQEAKVKKTYNDPAAEIDKDLYSWKGRFGSQISNLKSRRDKVNKPIHWG